MTALVVFMLVLTKEEFEQKKDLYKQKILDGAIFIYPTDTIYGLGCDARNKDAIVNIRKIKESLKQPFSVLVPSKDWIFENCLTTEEIEDWVKDKLPGPYTFILNLKDEFILAENINHADDSLGVRIPDCWFSHVIKYFDFPVVTTSANPVGKDFMVSLENLDQELKNHVDFIIYDGEKKGSPSKIIDFRLEDINYIDR